MPVIYDSLQFADMFLENIRQNHNIKGIIIGKNELKTPAFVDAATIYRKQ